MDNYARKKWKRKEKYITKYDRGLNYGVLNNNQSTKRRRKIYNAGNLIEDDFIQEIPS